MLGTLGIESTFTGPSVDSPSVHYLSLSGLIHPVQCLLCLLTGRRERRAGDVGSQCLACTSCTEPGRHLCSIFALLPYPSRTVLQHERNRDSRNCASHPRYIRPHQSSCRCDQECALPHRFAAETLLNSHLRLRTSLKVSRSS